MNFTLKEPMAPLWIMYPNIHRFSIGWRMGYGEHYKDDFWEWFESLDCREKETYEEMFPPPNSWKGIYDENYNFDEDEENYYVHEDEVVELWNKAGEMQYNLQKTINEFNGNTKNEFLFFWKPQNEIINESCLGQWHLSDFVSETNKYCCAEQYMMSEKARIFKDKEIFHAIMETKNPKEMKSLGKKVKNFEQAVWDKVKYSIVLNGNYYKFSQNKEIREYLLSTGKKILVEASPLDTVWGIGLGEKNEKSRNPNTWRGYNLLGFALMEVRDEIRTVYKNYNRINWKKINDIYGGSSNEISN